MKRKFIALALCLALIMSITVPSTLAMGIASDSSNYNMSVETTPSEQAVLPDATSVADNAEPTHDAVILPTDEAATAQPDSSAQPEAGEAVPEVEAPATSAAPTPTASATVEPSATPAADAEQPKEPTATAAPAASAKPAALSSEQVNAIYNDLMAASTLEEMENVLASLNDAELNALVSILTAEQIEQIDNKAASFTQPDPSPSVTSTVNFTNAAPFLPPVVGMNPHAEDDRVLSLPSQQSKVDAEGLKTSKTVSGPDENGQYTLTLEAWATGKKTITNQETQIPTDIVLVLDRSDSMNDPFPSEHYESVIDTTNKKLYNLRDELYVKQQDGSFAKVTVSRNWNEYTYSYQNSEGQTTSVTSTDASAAGPNWVFYVNQETTRLAALQSAVTQFTNSVAEKAKGPDGRPDSGDEVNHRIAVVGFAGDAEILIGSETKSYQDVISDSTICENAFQDMNQPNGVTNVHMSIDSLHTSGGTLTDKGVELGNLIFEHDPVKAGESRNRVMIVFTDGMPGRFGYQPTVAEHALKVAGTTKKVHNATVYTVGIFEGANANSEGKQNGNDIEKCNWFMQNLSSNNGKVQDPSYYLSAHDSEALNNIFKSISENIESGGSKIELDSQTVLKDVISDYFQLPEGIKPADIKTYTATYTGKGVDNGFEQKASFEASISIQDKTVSVTNFDYSENWVGTVTTNGETECRGKKLIVEIPIVVRNGFLGGNGVPTNKADSGIYTGDTVIENFPIPTTDVSIPDIQVTVTDKNIYLTQQPDKNELLEGATVQCGKTDINLKAENYGLEPWQTAFVTLNHSVTPPTDTINDSIYTVAFTVSPNSTGTVKEKNGSDFGTVNVFKPEITYQDSTINYGDKANYEEQNKPANNVVWKHDGTPAQDDTMIGDAPTLDFTYSPTESAFKEDTDVTVTVKIGNEDITNHVTLLNNGTTTNGSHQFTVYVQAYALTIQKTANAPGVFKFNVKNAENDVNMDVVIQVTDSNKPESVTITGLPNGTYTVTEDTNWSWNFTPTHNNQTTTLGATQKENTVSFTNTLNNKWLNNSVCVKNVPKMSTAGTN